MNKTLVAIAIGSLFTVGSTTAAEVYNQGGKTLSIRGEVSAKLVHDALMAI